MDKCSECGSIVEKRVTTRPLCEKCLAEKEANFLYIASGGEIEKNKENER